MPREAPLEPYRGWPGRPSDPLCRQGGGRTWPPLSPARPSVPPMWRPHVAASEPSAALQPRLIVNFTWCIEFLLKKSFQRYKDAPPVEVIGSCCGCRSYHTQSLFLTASWGQPTRTARLYKPSTHYSSEQRADRAQSTDRGLSRAVEPLECAHGTDKALGESQLSRPLARATATPSTSMCASPMCRHPCTSALTRMLACHMRLCLGRL